jgi:hypothetical protein
VAAAKLENHKWPKSADVCNSDYSFNEVHIGDFFNGCTELEKNGHPLSWLATRFSQFFRSQQPFNQTQIISSTGLGLPIVIWAATSSFQPELEFDCRGR